MRVSSEIYLKVSVWGLILLMIMLGSIAEGTMMLSWWKDSEHGKTR